MKNLDLRIKTLPNTSGGRRLNSEISGDVCASLLLPGTGSCGIIFVSKSDDGR